MADSTPVLAIDNLASLVDHRFIRVGQTNYDLRNRGELTVRQQIFLENNLGRLFQLVHLFATEDPNATDDDERALAVLLDQVLAIALDAPIEVRSALTAGEKMRTIRAFLRLPLAPSATTEAATPADTTSPGASSSPDSSASMAETPSAGSSASRSH